MYYDSTLVSTWSNVSELLGELTLMSGKKRAVYSSWHINESLSNKCTAFIHQTLIVSVLCVRVEFNYQGFVCQCVLQWTAGSAKGLSISVYIGDRLGIYWVSVEKYFCVLGNSQEA